jgi:hypothetical protein
MEKLEWHISNFIFCNGIFPKCESYSGIDPINPFIFGLKFDIFFSSPFPLSQLSALYG